MMAGSRKTCVSTKAVKYWEEVASEFKKLAASSPSPFEAEMSSAERRALTRRKESGKLLTADKAAAEVLIEQAIICCQSSGWEADECNLLRGWLEKGAPNSYSGRPAISRADKMAIHYLYGRMTGAADNDDYLIVDETVPSSPKRLQVPGQTTLITSHVDLSDVEHRLGRNQAYYLLRKIFGLKQNLLHRILDTTPGATSAQ